MGNHKGHKHKAFWELDHLSALVLFLFQKPQSFFLKRFNSLKLLELFFILSTIVVIFSVPFPAMGQMQEREIENLNQLPEGQTLLLRPRVGKIFYEDDIYALRHNDTLYYAVSDVIDILGLSINFDEENLRGEGWFLREDWKIKIDLPNQKIIAKEKEYVLETQDIIIEEKIMFLSQEKIESIFDFEFLPDISQQYVEIKSDYPLPKVASIERKRKRVGSRVLKEAALPRYKANTSWFDINTADIRLGSRLRRTEGQTESQRYNGLVTLEGQALKHNAYGLVTYDNQDSLNSVITRFSKRSEQAELLGPLKARSYSLGDTDIVDIPLTGDSRRELGFRVSNNTLENIQYESTDITGDALPGWDVELYRNGILSATQNVDQNGTYEFSNVQLFGGRNDFELFFYGPQGEIRRREVKIPITSAILKSQDGVYDVSVSLSDTQSYRKNQSDDEDRGTPHISGRYNKTIGNILTYIGARHRDVEGENKTIWGAGFTSLAGNTILDGSVGVDQKGEGGVQLTARRNIKEWDLVTTGQIQSDAFAPNGEINPQKLKFSTSAQRNFTLPSGDRASIFTRGELTQNTDKTKQISRELGGSYQVGPVNISNTLRYDTVDIANSGTTENLDNALSLRANLGEFFLRGGVNYDIYPQKKVDQYFSQLSYRPSSRFSGEITLNHDPGNRYSEGRLNLNYTNDYFRTSPFIEIDSNNVMNAGVNVNFSMIDTPNKVLPTLTSERISGRGLVSSFVYHDKNGNKIFDEGDEPLPDVVVESVNIRRRVETNARGYSLINNLPTTRATDIRLDPETLPDSFMMSGFEGISILPDAGEITELQFPVHLSGEIDGTVSVANDDGDVVPIKRANIHLYPLDKGKKNIIKTQAASDGFFVASKIPPGKYLMAISNDTARKNKAANALPKLIQIGYDGNVIYGEDVRLEKNKMNVPIEVSYTEEEKADTILYALKTAPQKRSKLLSLIGKIRQGDNLNHFLNGLTEVNLKGNEVAEYKRFLTPSNDLEESYKKCRELAEKTIPCTLEVIVPTS